MGRGWPCWAQGGVRAGSDESRADVLGLTAPREVISSKEKSKYKFPPAALPQEFSAFFQGQAPPLPPLGPTPKPRPLPVVP